MANVAIEPRECDLNFGVDGRIKSVTGDDSVTSLVTYQPAK
jgi:hypothetical protein